MSMMSKTSESRPGDEWMSAQATIIACKQKCGYLRKIFIHGARAVVLRSKRDRVAMGEWMTALEARAPRNVLIVATANKLARIAWAVLSSGQDYRAVQEPVAA
jgi:transposase